MYKHDFICFSETYPDSGYLNLWEVHPDHPDNNKRGGVCIYYKESLPVGIINLPYFKEALFLEISYINKMVIVSVIYRSPSQNNDDFDSIISIFNTF